MIVGGADHKVGQDIHPEHRFGELEDWTRRHFLMATSMEYHWSGEVMEPASTPLEAAELPVPDGTAPATSHKQPPPSSPRQ